MRSFTAALVALAFVTLACSAADPSTIDNCHESEGSAKSNIVQTHMFDGISLTEQQRQQMRDLMQRARHDIRSVNIGEMEIMHNLVIAEKFDEAAVRAQAEKMAQVQVERQVEMAKIRNQMYQLLTPEQRIILDEKHQKRISQFRALSKELQQHKVLQLSSSKAPAHH